MYPMEIPDHERIGGAPDGSYPAESGNRKDRNFSSFITNYR